MRAISSKFKISDYFAPFYRVSIHTTMMREIMTITAGAVSNAVQNVSYATPGITRPGGHGGTKFLWGCWQATGLQSSASATIVAKRCHQIYLYIWPRLVAQGQAVGWRHKQTILCGCCQATGLQSSATATKVAKNKMRNKTNEMKINK